MTANMKNIKIWTTSPAEAKAALDWLKSQGYNSEGFKRFYNPRMSGNSVGFFAYNTGNVSFTESKDFFDGVTYTLVEVPSSEVKPPLGLMPEYIWVAQRKKDLLAAMVRFTEADKPIPNVWIEELGRINGEIS